MSELENTLDEIGGCVDTAGEKIRELRDTAVKPSKLEQREKRLEETQSISEPETASHGLVQMQPCPEEKEEQGWQEEIQPKGFQI